MGKRRYGSIILDLGAKWRKVAGFTKTADFLPEKEPRYPFNRGFEEPQSCSERCPCRE
jgi:hypothetical protein